MGFEPNFNVLDLLVGPAVVVGLPELVVVWAEPVVVVPGAEVVVEADPVDVLA